MNAADVLSTMLFALDQGASPNEIMDENSPLMDEARRVLKPADPAEQAQPTPEPVAWRVNERVNREFVTGWNYVESEPPMQPYTVAIEPLYLHPSPAQTPLTDKQIMALWHDKRPAAIAFARAVLKAQKEKT